ncbi:MAG TPA: biotin/lipoyl-containing protein, partial [Gammaproteobacteria bacterium]|nr:biotin/lipoyl-containing protein [Gammaproteobacteria bacterium]
ERYKSISKETAGVLRGEYGATAAPVNAELQARVLGSDEPVTCRPADLIEPEMGKLTGELRELAKAENIRLADNEIDDVLIYALFQQVGINFLKNRGNPDAFEPAPGSEPAPAAASAAPPAAAPTASGVESYRVSVDGTQYDVVVGPGDADVSQVRPAASTPAAATTGAATPAAATTGGTEIRAPLAGSVLDILASVGQQINEGDPVVMIEAMKMETEIRASAGGKVQSIAVKVGDKITSDQLLLTVV